MCYEAKYWGINLVNLAPHYKHLTFTLLPGHHYKALPSQEEEHLMRALPLTPLRRCQFWTRRLRGGLSGRGVKLSGRVLQIVGANPSVGIIHPRLESTHGPANLTIMRTTPTITVDETESERRGLNL